MIDLRKRLGYEFKNVNLLKQALTHKSYANELKNTVEHNEKLEFLGDAVLALVVGEMLYRKFPQDNEGGLSKKRASVVNENVLSEIALEMSLNEILLLGKGEAQTGGSAKPRLLASAFEAVIGAMYLDAGFECVSAFLHREFETVVDRICQNEDFERDYKTRLQELVQKNLKQTPKYEVISEEGPPHDRVFAVCVKVQDEVWAQGRGRSKKIAEQLAAQNAIETKLKETQS